MDADLKEALKGVASDVGRILSNDGFPSTIYPECLCDAVRSYPMRGGKRVRPALLLWACGALGGDPAMALNAAAAVEVYHSWTLVHDDIIDEDDVRRGLPTTHRELCKYAESAYDLNPVQNEKFGRDMAILAGDIQQAWAVDLLMRTAEKGCPPELVMTLVRRMQNIVNRELISGEALDIELPMRDWTQVTKKDVLRVIEGKTACLLKYCVQTGGAIALRTADMEEPALKALGNYADALGIAFQLRDDYLGVFGELETFGKPLCSDFQESKPTLLFMEAMETLSPAGQKELLGMRALPEYDEEVVSRIRILLAESGAVDRILAEINRYTAQAIESLQVLPANQYRSLLLSLSNYLLERSV